MSVYYDRAGTEIGEECWKEYWANDEYRMLARTDVGEWTVAAWWAGVDEGPGRRIFRSALLVPPRQAGYGSPLLQEWRHAAAEEALAHHDELVSRLRSVEARAPALVSAAAEGCHCH